MARKCCVLSCEGDVRESRGKGLPLHKFPKNAALRGRWLASGGFHSEFKPSPGQLVCHRHFLRTDYDINLLTTNNKFLLKKGTIPTIFSDYENHPDPVNISMKTQYLQPQKTVDTLNSEIANAMQLTLENQVLETNENRTNEAEDVTTNENEHVGNETCENDNPSASNSSNMSFIPGTRLEAKGFSEEWHPARVVEADWVEREVLIHFDKWSSRFDEWIPMDSPRISQIQSNKKKKIKRGAIFSGKRKTFDIGDRVMATWADGRKYPAKVDAVLGHDRYNVLYDDGYEKIVKSSKMTKIAACKVDQTPAEFDKIEDDMKRKDPPVDLIGTDSKKAKIDIEESVLDEMEIMKIEGEQEIVSSELPGYSVPLMANSPQKPKSTKVKKESGKSETIDDFCPEWVNGEPQGTEAYILEGCDGLRRSIIVPDGRLPPGWQKHFTQRQAGSSAGKWDVFFIHESTTKKFRSRNDIKLYVDNLGQYPFDPEQFDFCIHRTKRSNMYRSKIDYEMRKSKATPAKTKFSNTSDPNLGTGSNVSTSTSSILPADDNAVFIGGLRVEMEDSAYKCPKEGCSKNFRKENLLQMHIKHYHPEYSKFLGTTPNVADLAYARTIRDISPKKNMNFLDRLGKPDKRKDKPQMPNQLQLSTTSAGVETEDCKDDLAAVLSSTVENWRGLDGGIPQNDVFNVKIKEEKGHTGVKTLLPVRTADSDLTPSMKKRQRGVNDVDDFEDFDDSTLDTEKSSFSYNFSYGKFDPRSDEFSENSQLNDFRCDNSDASKLGDVKKEETEEEGVMTMINGNLVKLERLRREEIINCTCGMMEEDGLMIQCDVCMCWQHGYCCGVNSEKEVPEKYICFFCQHSYRQRQSKKYTHDQEWLKSGKLPSVLNRPKDATKANQRTAILKRSIDLVAALLQIQDVLYSLRVKINIAQQKDHPKLYLWAKEWDKVVFSKLETEPVPVLKYVKSERKDVKPSKEDVGNVDSELDRQVRQDIDENSIASDLELMKILQDDTNPGLESKNICENVENQSTGKILMEALLKTDPESTATQESVQSANQKVESENIEIGNQRPIPPCIPEPEAPINLEECKCRLLRHISHFQTHIDAKLNAIEVQVAHLEKMSVENNEPKTDDSRMKETINMLLRDLLTIRKIASNC